MSKRDDAYAVAAAKDALNGYYMLMRAVYELNPDAKLYEKLEKLDENISNFVTKHVTAETMREAEAYISNSRGIPS